MIGAGGRKVEGSGMEVGSEPGGLRCRPGGLEPGALGLTWSETGSWGSACGRLTEVWCAVSPLSHFQATAPCPDFGAGGERGDSASTPDSLSKKSTTYYAARLLCGADLFSFTGAVLL